MHPASSLGRFCRLMVGSRHINLFLRKLWRLMLDTEAMAKGCDKPPKSLTSSLSRSRVCTERRMKAKITKTIENICSAARIEFARKGFRSEEHTSELQSLMRISYAVFCLKKNIKTINNKLIEPKLIHTYKQ